MRIRYKLIFGFAIVILFIIILSLYFINLSQNFLRKSTGKNSLLLAEEMLKRINYNIYLKIETLQSQTRDFSSQEYILKSNNEYEKIINIEEYITQMDKTWISVDKNHVTPFMKDILENDLSRNLREEITEFYKIKYGFDVFYEVFITNKFGAIIGLSGKTTDFKQDDENWWQQAKNNSIYISDIEYDESSEAYGIVIALKINDKNGNFIGILKALLSYDEIVREAEISTKKYKTTEVILTNKNGQIIYKTGVFNFMDKLSKDIFEKIKQNDTGYFTINDRGTKRLLSYTHSTAYMDFINLEWILMMTHDIKEVLSPIFIIKNIMFFTSFILIFISGITAFFISRSITRPIAELSKSIATIGKGDLNHRVKLKSKNEIGELAAAFNQMTEKRQRAEQALYHYNKRLRILREIDKDILRFNSEEGLVKTILKHLHIMIPVWQIYIVIINNIKTNKVISYSIKSENNVLKEDSNAISINNDEKIKQLRFGKNFLLKDKQSLKKSKILYLKKKIDIGLRSFFSAPSVVKDQLIGYIDLFSKKDNFFTDEHKEIIEEIADLLSIALQQVRMNEEIKKHNFELEARVKRRTKELENTNKELESFTYSVSHDLRAPLRHIDGFSTILCEDNSKSLDNNSKKYLLKIQTSVKQMSQLIDSLLHFSRVSRQGMNFRSVNLSIIAQKIIYDLKESQPERNVEFIFDQNIIVKADPILIRIVMDNLLRNAWKYTRNHNSARIEFGRKGDNKNPVYYIRDDGAGFDMAYSSKLFGVFQRLHSPEEFPGTGIGLATVQRIIYRHGGRVWAEGEVEKGATFYFTLSYKNK